MQHLRHFQKYSISDRTCGMWDEDTASKFFEHFLRIADAMEGVGEEKIALWDEADGFYYDALHFPDGHHCPMKVRSRFGADSSVCS